MSSTNIRKITFRVKPRGDDDARVSFKVNMTQTSEEKEVTRKIHEQIVELGFYPPTYQSYVFKDDAENEEDQCVLTLR